jgi:peptidoglycan hydrolase-like protein with peptidoglycan-binding domain
MNKAFKCAAFAAVTVVGFGVADTTHADGTATPPAGGLAALTAQPDVSGYVGPIALPDGTEVAVITRSDVATMTGVVELAVGRQDGWVVGQSFPIDGFVPDAPDGIGDLTGDGRTEIRVPLIASTGGKGWDLLYQIDSHGPSLDEIPFDTTALEATGVSPMSLHIDSLSVDHVATSIGTCTPSCAENIAMPVEWYLDHSGSSILRPVPPPPPPPVVDPLSCDAYSFNDQYPIRRCDEGYAVLQIQYLLVGFGYTVDADGYFGPGTEQAVRDFQRNAGLEVDGLVGPHTWSTLGGQQPGWDLDSNGIIDPDEVVWD